jgi:magnesium-transporting ATPase (P-type)
LDQKGFRKRVYVKGVASKLIARCKFFLSTECERIKKTPQNHDEMRKTIDKFNKKGLRTIVLAYRDLPLDFEHLDKDDNGVPLVEKKDLTLIAIVAILDPVKEGINDAVDQARDAGIKVYMVTGDSRVTAKTVALEAGILMTENEERIWDGHEFYEAVGKITKV